MSKHRTAAEIRQKFIDYFVEKCGHTFVPSSPCVPVDDPTLMFTNAGMNQFKPIFLGQKAPDVDKWPGARSGMATRAANTQKCIRAGGKHNDLDDVGHDTYHHTFFEMLGNWSFGDYFKKEAIAWAWDLLTNVWGIDPTRLHATYFEGVRSEPGARATGEWVLEPDTEARDLWLKILPPERVHPGNMKDNFWEMGDTGPCGPCSEIHIDLTPDKSGGPLVNAGDARVIEIWNLVFIQFNRGADGTLSPLPAKHVDTGMGFERLCAVLQGMDAGRLGRFSNYDTDVFTPIFVAIHRVTGAPEYTGLLESETPDSSPKPLVMKDVAYRVVADHVRTLTFAITDGALPSNEGRGYVLRRILRRAVRYGRQYLNTHRPFMCELVPALVETMGEAFPELRNAHGGKNVEHVASVIRDEEASFIKTLDRGIALFEEAADDAVKRHHGRISGEDAFKLHDTYGFPIDLTELMAEERGLTIDIGEYERLMEAARERARATSAQKRSFIERIVNERFAGFTPVDDRNKYSDLGTEHQAMVLGFVQANETEGYVVSNLNAGVAIPSDEDVALLLDQTCFYSEAGGQVSDRGRIISDSGEFEVLGVFRLRNQIAHYGRVVYGEITTNSKVRLVVDESRRSTMKNHTATHVLNWALRDVLGAHVQQKGSLVDPEKTRFDLSHPSQIPDEELARIEELVNSQIEEDLEVFTAEVDQKKAREINTLRAVFGEKYPDMVRVVSIGVPVEQLLADPKNDEWMRYSVEFCGGTHVKRTGDIKRFRLIEESAVAKGIRRVVGVTGEKAAAAEANAEQVARLLVAASRADDAALPALLADIATKLSRLEMPVVEKSRLRADLSHLQERAKRAAKAAAKTGAADASARADELLAGAANAGGVTIIAGELPGATVDQLRAACDSLRARAGSAAVLLASEDGGKVVLMAAMTPDVVNKGVKAGDLIKEVAPFVGGKGGGRPDMAQGGGTDPTKIGEAVEAAKTWLAGRLA